MPLEAEYLKLGLSQNIWEATLSLAMGLCPPKDVEDCFNAPRPNAVHPQNEGNHVCMNSPGGEVKRGWMRGALVCLSRRVYPKLTDLPTPTSYSSTWL